MKSLFAVFTVAIVAVICSMAAVNSTAFAATGNTQSIRVTGGPETYAKWATRKDCKAIRRFNKHAAGIVELGKCLQRWHYEVSEHPRFGGVHPVHSTNPVSCHYKRSAIDINSDYYGNESRRLTKLNKWAKHYRRKFGDITQLYWKCPGHYNHLHISWHCGDQ